MWSSGSGPRRVEEQVPVPAHCETWARKVHRSTWCLCLSTLLAPNGNMVLSNYLPVVKTITFLCILTSGAWTWRSCGNRGCYQHVFDKILFPLLAWASSIWSWLPSLRKTSYLLLFAWKCFASCSLSAVFSPGPSVNRLQQSLQSSEWSWERSS